MEDYLLLNHSGAQLLTNLDLPLLTYLCDEEDERVLDGLNLSFISLWIFIFQSYDGFLDRLIKYLNDLLVWATRLKTCNLISIHFNEAVLGSDVLIWLLFKE